MTAQRFGGPAPASAVGHYRAALDTHRVELDDVEARAGTAGGPRSGTPGRRNRGAATGASPS
jgi:hypothetical protein